MAILAVQQISPAGLNRAPSALRQQPTPPSRTRSRTLRRARRAPTPILDRRREDSPTA